ncbi:hypothetical protein L9F63_025345 [Diploptera punctata]|uniref:Uncharacterized protein n=1 Tax=Diploptera punctata TaxID=6984 RepID=A0AAD8E4R0_DIPPU|nr:hypothetical protein L9F63_025345 [Diploptera punctata]
MGSVLIVGKMNTLPLAFHHFDGFIIVLLEQDFSPFLPDRFPDLMYNSYIRKMKIIFVILGKPNSLEPLVVFVERYSLYQAIVLIKDEFSDEINIFIWYSGNCGDMSNITLLHTCKKGETLEESMFESIKRPTDFENCTILEIVPNDPPFSYQAEYNGTTIREGSDVSIVEIIASHFGFNLIYNMAVDKPRFRIEYGNPITKINQIAHMKRYCTKMFTWFVPRAQSNPRISSLTRVYSSLVWICVLLVLVFVSSFLKYLGAFGSSDISENILSSFGLFLNVSAPRTPPGTKLRTIFFAWVAFSISFTTVFQAYMTSFFTDPGRKHQMDTLDELENSDLKLYLDRYRMNYWHLMIRKIRIYYFPSSTLAHKIEMGVNNSDIALLLSDEYFTYNFPREINWKFVFHKFSEPTVSIHHAMFMHITSPFVPLVNKVTERLVEAGIVDHLVSSYVDPTGQRFSDKSEESLIDIFEPLSLFHIFSSILYLFLGFSLSFIAFFGEVLVYWLRPRSLQYEPKT